MSVIHEIRTRAVLKTAAMASVGQYFFRNGLKATINRYGWRLIAIVFVSYLVRDITLYIAIPWWAARSLMGQ
jgi:hypothetical protein